MTDNSYYPDEFPKKIIDGKTLEIGKIIEGKLYRLQRIGANGVHHYEQTRFTFDPNIPEGECEYIGSIKQEQFFDINKGLQGSPTIKYEAEMIFTWKRIK